MINIAQSRREHLLGLLESGKFLSVSEVIERANASPATVRRDLTELEKQGLILRTHGAVAAKSVHSEPDFSEKLGRYYDRKRRIAKVAKSLICPGTSIYIDAGSTCHALAELIDASLNLTVVTNSFASINTLSTTGVDAWCLGGKLRKVSGAFIGNLALEQLQRFRFDFAFIGASALDERGIYTTEDEEYATKRLAILQARQAVLLADTSKLEEHEPVRFAEWKDFDLWALESAPPRKLSSTLKKAKCGTLHKPRKN